MLFQNIAMAFTTLTRYKWRSFMTMLGVAIGVVSVVTIVSIGEGAKKDVLNQVNYFENELITVHSGNIGDVRATSIEDINNLITAEQTLTEQDVASISDLASTRLVTGFNAIIARVTYDSNDFNNVKIYGVEPSLKTMLGQNVQYGEFFTTEDDQKPVAVIGRSVAESIFKDKAPIARKFSVLGQEIVVRGVYEPFPKTALNPYIDYNNAIFLPYDYAKKLSKKPVNVVQIMALGKKDISSEQYAQNVEEAIAKNHNGVSDFSVLTKSQSYGVYESVLNILTSVVTGIAAVSLLVAGVGIMNIMLVSVAERNEEIGTRKAIGATNQQIMSQFLAEATILSIMGGIFGLLSSLVANYFIRIFSDLRPIISLDLALFAFLVSLLLGILFGMAPALNAARKDPVLALRRG